MYFVLIRYMYIFGAHQVYFVLIRYILCSLGIFCAHQVYFVLIRYILRLSGIFCGHLVNFLPHFGMLCQEKSGNPDSNPNRRKIRLGELDLMAFKFGSNN
jgi:hypothetical protein